MTETVKGTLEVPLRPKGFAVGVDVKDGKVQKLYPSSVFLGYLYTNDMIKSVNGKPIANTAEFFKIVMENSPGKVTIEYERDETSKTTIKTMTASRPNFEAIEVILEWKTGGTPLGLLVHKDSNNQVIIGMVESGSAASKAVMAGDILMKVNSVAINDRDQARGLIIESINKDKKVALYLERPKREGGVSEAEAAAKSKRETSSAAPSAPSAPAVQAEVAKSKREVSTTTPPPASPKTPSAAPASASTATPPPAEAAKSVSGAAPATAPAAPPPSVYTPTIRPTTSYIPPPFQVAPSTFKKNPNADPPLPKDVLEIMAANLEFFKIAPAEAGILRVAKAENPGHIVEGSLTEKQPEQEITFDPSPKPLKITPKRVGS